MLAEASSAKTAAAIQRSIDALQASGEKRRGDVLKKAAVVGVTCSSCVNAAMDGLAFDVVVLDEVRAEIDSLID